MPKVLFGETAGLMNFRLGRWHSKTMQNPSIGKLLNSVQLTMQLAYNIELFIISRVNEKIRVLE